MTGYGIRAFRRDMKELAGLLSQMDGIIHQAAPIAGRVCEMLDRAADAEGTGKRAFPQVDEAFGMLDRARQMILDGLTGGEQS